MNGVRVEARCARLVVAAALSREALHKPVENPTLRRQGASRVGLTGVAGQQECLAATAAEIDLAPVAVPARLGHPGGPAEALERV